MIWHWVSVCFAAIAVMLNTTHARGEQIKPFRDHPLAPYMVDVPIGGGIAMAQTETTFRQWEACVSAGGCRPITDDHYWGRGERPLINVSWRDAQAYAAWLSQLTGQPYRLPTAEEWMFAATAGKPTAYWWGDEVKSGMMRCRQCDADAASDYGTVPVRSYLPNPLGLYDMHGNVWEWVADCVEQSRAGACRFRATYGGAWYYVSHQSRADAVAARPEAERSFTLGFRVASDRR
jgi:formylglycine-generating enzyme required for sulfatase activity